MKYLAQSIREFLDLHNGKALSLCVALANSQEHKDLAEKVLLLLAWSLDCIFTVL